MQITKENYFSQEANNKYMSVSQYKDALDCEERAIKTLSGEWIKEEKLCFLEGKYLHAYFEGGKALEKLKEEHPEMYSTRGESKGQLKSGFMHIERMMKTLIEDDFVMEIINNPAAKKEVVLTGEIGGVKWKGMVDILHPLGNVEIKTAKNINEMSWVNGERVNFIQAYNYILQAAVYHELRRQNYANEKIRDSIMVVVDKQPMPDKEIIQLYDEVAFNDVLNVISGQAGTPGRLDRVMAVKTGQVTPNRCGKCAYCRSTKKLSKIVPYWEIGS